MLTPRATTMAEPNEPTEDRRSVCFRGPVTGEATRWAGKVWLAVRELKLAHHRKLAVFVIYIYISLCDCIVVA